MQKKHRLVPREGDRAADTLTASSSGLLDEELCGLMRTLSSNVGLFPLTVSTLGIHLSEQELGVSL